MPASPGSPAILKGAFVHYSGNNSQPGVIIFAYNPASLCRTIQPRTSDPTVSQLVDPGSEVPMETITFRLPLDATDQLEQANPQAVASGVYPVLSAIELLMYPSASGSHPLTLFLWGADRVLPVRVTELRIVESVFDPQLHPIQASVDVTLVVLSSADLPDGGSALNFWNKHLATLNSLAASLPPSGLGPTGVTALNAT